MYIQHVIITDKKKSQVAKSFSFISTTSFSFIAIINFKFHTGGHKKRKEKRNEEHKKKKIQLRSSWLINQNPLGFINWSVHIWASLYPLCPYKEAYEAERIRTLEIPQRFDILGQPGLVFILIS